MAGPAFVWHVGAAVAQQQAEPPAPANPVIGFRYGQPVLEYAKAFIELGFQRFPYFQLPPPASPVIGFRYGQPVLEYAQAFVAPHVFPFPYFQPPVGANLIEFLYGRGELRGAELRTEFSAHFARFPYFVPPPAAPSNPVIPIRRAPSSSSFVGMTTDHPPGAKAAFSRFPFVPTPVGDQGNYTMLHHHYYQ